VDRNIYIDKLRQYGIENTIPNISDVNVKFLKDLIKISSTKNMLEIWTANWFSWINFWIELEKIWWKLLSRKY
jgi:predicted O-methyltransferase YrrM